MLNNAGFLGFGDKGLSGRVRGLRWRFWFSGPRSLLHILTAASCTSLPVDSWYMHFAVSWQLLHAFYSMLAFLLGSLLLWCFFDLLLLVFGYALLNVFSSRKCTTDDFRFLHVKGSVGNFEKPATPLFRSAPPFRPPSKATPPKPVTSTLTWAIGLHSLTEDSGHATWVHRQSARR